MPVKWTQTEYNILRRMRFEGATWTEIGKRLGRTSDACINYAMRRDQEHRKKVNLHSTICWECGRASGMTLNGIKCPWADRLEPVPGWEAIATKYTSYNGGKHGPDRSFIVNECPLFTEHHPQPHDLDDDTATALYGQIIRGMVEEWQTAEALMCSTADLSKRRAAAADFLWFDDYFGDSKTGAIARKLLQDYELGKEVAGTLR